MTIKQTTPNKIRLFQCDCEVDYYIARDRMKGDEVEDYGANITEFCIRSDSPTSKNYYYTTYVKKHPRYAHYDGPFQKPIPSGRLRCDFKDSIQKIFDRVATETPADGVAIMMGYNVHGWDAEVLAANCTRFGANQPTNWKWFDIAGVAHQLGYPMGTTQQQLERALQLEGLPANRHRAHADTRVVHKIWQKFLGEMSRDQARLDEIKLAMNGDNPEENVAELIRRYNPSIVPSDAQLDCIRRDKAAEKVSRIPLVVLFDLETTGLQQEKNKDAAAAHNTPPRIVEFAAKIISPFGEEPIDFCELVNPGIEIPEEASAVHNITDEMVKTAPKIQAVWEKFEAWCQNSNAFKNASNDSTAEPQLILVGYNSDNFDIEVLTQELLRVGYDFTRKKKRQVFKTWDAIHFVRTIFSGKEESQKPSKMTLEGVREFLNIPSNQAHRALGDVQTTYAVLKAILGTIEPSGFIQKASSMPKPGISPKEMLQNMEVLLDEGMEEQEALMEAFRQVMAIRKREAKEEKEKTSSRNSPLPGPIEQGSIGVASLSCGGSLPHEEERPLKKRKVVPDTDKVYI